MPVVDLRGEALAYLAGERAHGCWRGYFADAVGQQPPLLVAPPVDELSDGDDERVVLRHGSVADAPGTVSATFDPSSQQSGFCRLCRVFQRLPRLNGSLTSTYLVRPEGFELSLKA